jgi:hypothetical protein
MKRLFLSIAAFLMLLTTTSAANAQSIGFHLGGWGSSWSYPGSYSAYYGPYSYSYYAPAYSGYSYPSYGYYSYPSYSYRYPGGSYGYYSYPSYSYPTYYYPSYSYPMYYSSPVQYATWGWY